MNNTFEDTILMLLVDDKDIMVDMQATINGKTIYFKAISPEKYKKKYREIEHD